ncbi:hypothetical protein DHEL01_v203302 [Diaporthe helianthi]|uniref:Uncharacterized protein n=1 Tax=Diaporthe helianthi TaxID=158607 RepID=A0A2P5I735_DIAHE|nr:hypothetical protein DHEL01_v203302 [Diaporthe helianthi]
MAASGHLLRLQIRNACSYSSGKAFPSAWLVHLMCRSGVTQKAYRLEPEKDLSGLQAGAAQGLLGLRLLQRTIDVRAWHLGRQYNLGGEKLGTQDRQLPLINWSEARYCGLQEGSATRPVGRVINAELQRANHMLVSPSPGQKRHAGCHFSQATFALLQGEIPGQKKHTEKL